MTTITTPPRVALDLLPARVAGGGTERRKARAVLIRTTDPGRYRLRVWTLNRRTAELVVDVEGTVDLDAGQPKGPWTLVDPQGGDWQFWRDAGCGCGIARSLRAPDIFEGL